MKNIIFRLYFCATLKERFFLYIYIFNNQLEICIIYLYIHIRKIDYERLLWAIFTLVGRNTEGGSPRGRGRRIMGGRESTVLSSRYLRDKVLMK